MKILNLKVVILLVTLSIFSGAVTTFAQFDDGSWSTTYPTYDTGSWSTTYPTYDTGSWSTTYPTYDTGSWSTTYPTYDTGTSYPTYDTGSWSTTYPAYDTGASYPVYDTGYTYPSYNTDYTYPTYSSYGYSGYTYPSGVNYSVGVSWTGYNYNGGNSVPTTQYQTCWNGTTIPTTQTCPVQTTTQCSNLSDSYTVSYNNNYPTCTKVCTNGTTIASNALCPSTTVNPTPTYVCSNGTVVTYSYQCPSVYVPPIYTTPSYTYQTCWDGTIIPTTQTCATQYKVCANGTSIPTYQTCYYGNTYIPYVAPQTTKFNSVVTSIATQVTNTSARCNGIGLIANNAQSKGWFEYGETSNLGRTTNEASIGTSASAPFSNLLTNLKSNTTYYCRAVMQNQYGTVKGRIVPFTTKSKAVTYVQPVTTKTVIKSTIKKNEIICSDGSVVTVGNQSAATLLSRGEKLIALQMVKTGGTLSANDTVSYTLTYKNLSDTRLTNVVARVTMPQEVTNIISSVGNYDENTHILTLNQDTIDPYTEGVITWTGKIVKDASVGKSIVTTAYTVYTVPSTSVQDEVTAYVVGSIVPSTHPDSTGSKNVIGAGERSFLPSSLVEWLALIAILFIIYILGRSVYASYQEDRK